MPRLISVNPTLSIARRTGPKLSSPLIRSNSVGGKDRIPTRQSRAPIAGTSAAHRQRRERKCPSGASMNISASRAMASWPPNSWETQPAMPPSDRGPGPPLSRTQ